MLKFLFGLGVVCGVGITPNQNIILLVNAILYRDSDFSVQGDREFLVFLVLDRSILFILGDTNSK